MRGEAVVEARRRAEYSHLSVCGGEMNSVCGSY